MASSTFDVSQPLGLDLKLQQIGVSRLRIDQLSICPGKRRQKETILIESFSGP